MSRLAEYVQELFVVLARCVSDLDAKSRSIDSTFDAFELKNLIDLRIKDVAKQKELNLETNEFTSEEALELMHLENVLCASLARCDLYLLDSRQYREHINEHLKKGLFQAKKSYQTIYGFGCLGLAVSLGIVTVRFLYYWR